MNKIVTMIISIVIGLLVTSKLQAEKLADLINYLDLDHNIELNGFRAGNHDTSGVNDYYFQVNIFALAILKEERKKEFSERLKVERDAGNFGDLQLKTLSYWPKNSNGPKLRILGEDLRDLMSEAMRTFKVAENQVAILTKIFLFEKNKQFVFFGEDLLVGQTSYHIIPESLPHQPKIENRTIQISDDLGTLVKIDIKYDALDPKKKKKK